MESGVEGWHLVVRGLVVTFCILSACCASSPESPGSQGTRLSDTQKQNIQTFVRKLMKCYSVPGLTLAVVGEGENDAHGDDHDDNYWTYVDNFGKADIVKGIEVTNETKFLLASVTKSFTSTLIAMLLEESNGSYTWNTPIRTILGDSFYLGDNYITNKVTLTDILSHRVGVGRHDYLWALGFIRERKELMKRLHTIDIQADFRTRYLYSNIMYALGGVVAEKIGGQPWEALIREKIFEPLGMKSSTFLNKMAPDYNGLARAHYWMNNGSLEQIDMALYQYIESVGAAGSIATTAEDMVRWLRFLLRGGKNSEDKALMTPEALFYTHKPRITWPGAKGLAWKPQYPASERYNTYGMGWFCGDYRGHESVMHSGSFSGYETRVSLQKTPQIGIYTNMNGPLTGISQLLQALIHMYIADVAMMREPWLTEENVCSFPEPWEPQRYGRYPGSAFFVDKTIQPTRDLKDYTGTYANYLYGGLEVWVNGSEGRLEAATKSLSYRFAMYPNGTDDEFWFIALGTQSFFHTSDVWGEGPPTPPTVKFTNGGGKGKGVSQLQWQIDDLVVFERDLDIRQLPKPDFSQGCTGASAALQQQLLYVLYGLFVREIVKGDLLLS